MHFDPDKYMQFLRHTLGIFLVLVCSSFSHRLEGGYGVNDTALPATQNGAFKIGERLQYRLHYGFVDAGTAVLEVKDSPLKFHGRSTYHVVGTGKTNWLFDNFYEVRDTYESYIDAKGIFPWRFVRRVNEGGFIINQDYEFHQHESKVDNGEGEQFQVPIGVQDMISAFYYARTIDFSKAKKGDIFTVESFVDDELYPIQIKYMGTDTIDIDAGEFSCLKFVPVVQQGRVFKDEEDLLVWITNDENQIPVLAKASVLVGSIKMELEDYDNLANKPALVD